MKRIAVFIFCISCSFAKDHHDNREKVGLTWESDEQFALLASSVNCDFPIINGHHFSSFEDLPYQNIPFIVTNLTDEWRATENWQKWKLLSNYGKRNIRSGSEASIVYSGGNAEFSTSLEEFIHSFDNETCLIKDQFLFDITILNAIPELKEDFLIPHLFQDWDHAEREHNREIWHMLSLGPSRTGLPFHNHGRTWIAVLYGSKRWFLYPPGFNAPQDIDNRFPRMISAWKWFQDYYPLLKDLPKPHASHHVSTIENGFRPFECIQRPGDIMFLPDLWLHLTLNIGETIGIGTQEAIPSQRRFSIAREAHSFNPRNYEALKDLGISIYYHHRAELDKYRNSLQIESNIILLPNQELFIKFQRVTKDSMIVIHYLTQRAIALEQLLLILKQYDLPNVMDIVLVPNTEDSAHTICLAADSSEGCSYPIYRIEVFQTKTIETAFEDLNDINSLHEEDDDGSADPSMLIQNIPIQTIHEFPSRESLLNLLPEPSFLQSIHLVPVRFRQVFQIAILYLRKALEIKPFHPDSTQVICEMYSSLQMYSEMKALIEVMERFYDNVHHTMDISQRTIASMYYKIATLAHQIYGEEQLVMRLLEKSTDRDPTLLLAWQLFYSILEKTGEEERIVSSFHQQLSGIILPLIKPHFSEFIFQGSISSKEIQALLSQIIEDSF